MKFFGIATPTHFSSHFVFVFHQVFCDWNAAPIGGLSCKRCRGCRERDTDTGAPSALMDLPALDEPEEDFTKFDLAWEGRVSFLMIFLCFSSCVFFCGFVLVFPMVLVHVHFSDLL